MPSAYVRLLEVVANTTVDLTVLRALPPAIPKPVNDQRYWSKVLPTIICKLVDERCAVWPALDSSGSSVRYLPSNEVIFIDPSAGVGEKLILLLERASIHLCQIPPEQSVTCTVLQEKANIKMLSPTLLHSVLTVRMFYCHVVLISLRLSRKHLISWTDLIARIDWPFYSICSQNDLKPPSKAFLLFIRKEDSPHLIHQQSTSSLSQLKK